ncbi:AAA domain-containing protein [Nocardia farcinica]|uniref:AAA domain-containing protein n=1 Tax=Nocardia farcinica TaxID=37329 RepID=UPI0002D631C3|nr:AAA domain-containing protein [Nocardia farcinica]
MDPRQQAVLIRKSVGQPYSNRTRDVTALRLGAAGPVVTFSGGGSYRYGWDRVLILDHPHIVRPGPGTRIMVRGQLRSDVTTAYHFAGRGEEWWHLVRGDGEYEVRRGSSVEIVTDAGREPRTGTILAYWRAIADLLPEGGQSLRKAYGDELILRPDSALYRYLNGTPITPTAPPVGPPLYPFHTNLSQREALQKALTHPLSVIDGPPGTGKTQTILNLIANVIVDETKTVAVVSSNNAAVDNVHAKLVKAGFGYVIANLGRRSKKERFFADQDVRNSEVDRLRMSAEAVPMPPAELVALDGRLLALREMERELAQLTTERSAYELERSHFAEHLENHRLPGEDLLPVLRWSSTKILSFIAATDPELARTSGLARHIERIRNYFRFRSLRFADSQDVDLMLRLQRQYYDRKIAELDQRIDELQSMLSRRRFDQLAEEQRTRSVAWLTEHLRRRYAGRPTRRYDNRYLAQWGEFSRDYPVIASTCHSLGASIGRGRLVDYLIIDEASQVDLLAAGAAMACCRHLVVVGDLRQLAPVVDVPASSCPAAPAPAYDYHRHSILSSLLELHGDHLPRTMLREHYRCDPGIIGFCNQKYYADDLVPFTRATPGHRAMVLVRTERGNHMRTHRDGGKINQREIDVVREEVLPEFCAEFGDEQIGITTPFRRQADLVTDQLIRSIESDTVHSFQGREKEAIVMTTVLDETRSGYRGLEFADKPQLVNVAVSRARKRFVLVTNFDLLPRSRNLRDLIGYIRYQNPRDDVFDSSIVSVFDLLYRDYSARLAPLAARLRGNGRYKSEAIMRALLETVLAEPEFEGYWFREQVFVKNLLPDTTRLDPEQREYVQGRASVDFDVFNRITKERLCVIEVDGFEFHAKSPEQQARDAIKDRICVAYEIPLLRFPTTGSGEVERLRRELGALIRARDESAPPR